MENKLNELEKDLDRILIELDDEIIPSKMDLAEKVGKLIEECEALTFENIVLNIALENDFETGEVELLAELIAEAGEKLQDDSKIEEEDMQNIINEVRQRKKSVKH